MTVRRIDAPYKHPSLNPSVVIPNANEINAETQMILNISSSIFPNKL